MQLARNRGEIGSELTLGFNHIIHFGLGLVLEPRINQHNLILVCCIENDSWSIGLLDSGFLNGVKSGEY